MSIFDRKKRKQTAASEGGASQGRPRAAEGQMAAAGPPEPGCLDDLPSGTAWGEGDDEEAPPALSIQYSSLPGEEEITIMEGKKNEGLFRGVGDIYGWPGFAAADKDEGPGCCDDVSAKSKLGRQGVGVHRVFCLLSKCNGWIQVLNLSLITHTRTDAQGKCGACNTGTHGHSHSGGGCCASDGCGCDGHHGHSHGGLDEPLLGDDDDGEGMSSAKAAGARRQLLLATLFCSAFLCVEVAGGIFSHSVAVLSDAVHLFGDVIAFAISLLAIHLSTNVRSSSRYTFGLARAETLGALSSTLITWALTAILVYEAAQRAQYILAHGGKPKVGVAHPCPCHFLSLLLSSLVPHPSRLSPPLSPPPTPKGPCGRTYRDCDRCWRHSRQCLPHGDPRRARAQPRARPQPFPLAFTRARALRRCGDGKPQRARGLPAW